jgi:hypothetical protein
MVQDEKRCCGGTAEQQHGEAGTYQPEGAMLVRPGRGRGTARREIRLLRRRARIRPPRWRAEIGFPGWRAEIRPLRWRAEIGFPGWRAEIGLPRRRAGDGMSEWLFRPTPRNGFRCGQADRRLCGHR